MKPDKEPELSLLFALVNPPDREEWQWQPEGGQQVDHSLPHHALAKLGRVAESMAGHQHDVSQDKEPEKLFRGSFT